MTLMNSFQLSFEPSNLSLWFLLLVKRSFKESRWLSREVQGTCRTGNCTVWTQWFQGQCYSSVTEGTELTLTRKEWQKRCPEESSWHRKTGLLFWSGTRGLGGQWVVQRKSLFSDWCYIQAKSTRRIQETHSRQRISVETVTIYFDSLFSDDNVAVNNLLPSLSSCAGRRPFSVLSNSPLSLQNFKRWLRLRTPWWRQWELRNVGHDFVLKKQPEETSKGYQLKR